MEASGSDFTTEYLPAEKNTLLKIKLPQEQKAGSSVVLKLDQ
jgi:hypothetical protein